MNINLTVCSLVDRCKCIIYALSIAIVVTAVYMHNIKNVSVILQNGHFSYTCRNSTAATSLGTNNKFISAPYQYLLSRRLLYEDRSVSMEYCRQFQDFISNILDVYGWRFYVTVCLCGKYVFQKLWIS